MIKGCQKRILFVEGNENSPFETAYFVLRKGTESQSGDDDIVRAADNIIKECLPEENRRQKRKARAKQILVWTSFALSGFLVGGGTVAIVSLFK